MSVRRIWLDGTSVAWDQARVSILSHAMQRGSLVFDVGAMREAAGGGRFLFRPRDHIARLLRSAALVGLEVRESAAAIFDATLATARAADVRSALVRWSAFVPMPEADVVPRADTQVSLAIAVITREDYAVGARQVPATRPSVNVTIPPDLRKAGPEVLPPQAKAAAGYLGPMLAKRRAIADGFDEVVLLDGEGRVAEAPTANVFAVLNGSLVTPPIERVLAGITRDSVLAIARAEGIPAREAHLGPDDLRRADEAFLTATSLPVQPIASIDGQMLRSAEPGSITARIRRAVEACERGEDARFPDWSVPV